MGVRKVDQRICPQGLTFVHPAPMIDCVGSIPRWGRVGGWPRVPTASTEVERGGQPPAQRDGSLTTEDPHQPQGACRLPVPLDGRRGLVISAPNTARPVGRRWGRGHPPDMLFGAPTLRLHFTRPQRHRRRRWVDRHRGLTSTTTTAGPQVTRNGFGPNLHPSEKTAPLRQRGAHGLVRPTVTRAGRIRGGFTWFKQFLGHLPLRGEVLSEGIERPLLGALRGHPAH